MLRRKAQNDQRERPKVSKTLAALGAHYGTRDLTTSMIHAWEDPAFVYFNNPKVACSTTKASLNMADAAHAGVTLEYKSLTEVHNRGHNLLKWPYRLPADVIEHLLTDKDVIRFCFLRDPLTRFISAYASKIRSKSRQREILFEHLGLDVEAKLGIEEMAEIFVDDKVARELNRHWQPQRRAVAYDLVEHRFFGRQERLAEDFRTVTSMIFGAPADVFDTRSLFGNVTADSVKRTLRTDRLEALVRQAYAEDYAMLEDIEARGMSTL